MAPFKGKLPPNGSSKGRAMGDPDSMAPARLGPQRTLLTGRPPPEKGHLERLPVPPASLAEASASPADGGPDPALGTRSTGGSGMNVVGRAVGSEGGEQSDGERRRVRDSGVFEIVQMSTRDCRL